ncbi:MAG: zinc ribbon domain-containing protein [Haloarculaceae archaeon]
MSERGLAAVGAYAPDLRISADEFADAWGSFEASGITEKAVPDADEDALTMGAEAATRALSAADLAPDAVDFLAFASTTPPQEEEDLTARLASVLGVPGTATTHLFSGSTRAGTRALWTGLDADYEGAGLVVAADCPHGEPDDAREHAAGAGAAAFVLRADAPGRVVDRGEYTTPYPGQRFRQPGSRSVEGLDVTSYDRQAFSEALSGAVADVEVGEVDAAAVQAPDGKRPYRGAGALGVESEAIQACATVHGLGDTAAASVPLSLARALDDGAGRVLAAAFGSGAGADALVVENEGVPADLAIDGGRELSYAEYLRRRGEITTGEPEGGGAYVSVPTWRRSLPQRHRLVAGACPDCGELTFPPEGACGGCGELVEFESVALPGEGEVTAITTIGRGGAPPEFGPQQAKSGDFQVAIVEFEGPDGEGSVSAPAQAVSTAELEAGDRVQAVVRRIYTQEGVTRYGFKVQPA